MVDASFIGLDSTTVMANTKQNNQKSFVNNKYSRENHPKSDPDCALGVHSVSKQHNERRFEYCWGYKSHVLVDFISGLPLYELTTPANAADSTVAVGILAAADRTLSLKECTFLADKGYVPVPFSAFAAAAIFSTRSRSQLPASCTIRHTLSWLNRRPVNSLISAAARR